MDQGYWGPRTASVDWCEENYVVTQYVAEFWNTLSSLAMVLSGLYGTYNAVRYAYATRFLLPSALMIFVGLGSIWFHGTLMYPGQVLDELSMVYCVSAYLYLVLETEAATKRHWLPAALLAYDIAFTAVYLLFPQYFIFFVATFIVLCIVVVAKSISLYRDTVDHRLKPLFCVGFGAYASAFLFFWIPDQLFCSTLGPLNLHAWFHVLSALSSYWFGVFIIQRFYEDRWAEQRGWSVVLGQPGSSPTAGKWGLLREERIKAAAAARLTGPPTLHRDGLSPMLHHYLGIGWESPRDAGTPREEEVGVERSDSAGSRSGDGKRKLTAGAAAANGHGERAPSPRGSDRATRHSPRAPASGTPCGSTPSLQSPMTLSRLAAMRADAAACTPKGQLGTPKSGAVAAVAWLFSPSSARGAGGRTLGSPVAAAAGSPSSPQAATDCTAAGYSSTNPPQQRQPPVATQQLLHKAGRSPSSLTDASADSTPAQSPRSASRSRSRGGAAQNTAPAVSSLGRAASAALEAAVAAGRGSGGGGRGKGAGLPPPHAAAPEGRAAGQETGRTRAAVHDGPPSSAASSASSTTSSSGVPLLGLSRLRLGLRVATSRGAGGAGGGGEGGRPEDRDSGGSSARSSRSEDEADGGRAASSSGAAAVAAAPARGGGTWGGGNTGEHTSVLVVPELVFSAQESWISLLVPHVRLMRKEAVE